MAKKPPLHYLEKLRKLKNSGVDSSPPINRIVGNIDGLPSLEKRIRHVLGIINHKEQYGYMMFFIMYDIESNKVRYNVVKYLERMGCHRIQKSIFLANLIAEKYEAIKNDLAEIQSLYDNHDSIIICPVSTDILKCMKIIGQNINLDVILHSKNTLFF